MTDGNGKNGWGFFAGTYDKDKPYFYWPSLLLGIFGAVNNLFVLTVLINRQRTPHLTTLKSIAFSDLGISLNLLVLLNCPDHFKLPENILGDLACPVFFSLYLVFALAATSGWHIVWFTLDIYGGQGNYNWHRLLFGSKIRIRLSLLFLWVLGFTIQNSSLWNYNIDRESHTCVLTWKSDAVRYVLSGALVLIFIIILPLVIMLWCYISLFKKLYHAKNYYQLKSETIQSLENEEKYKMVRKFLISSSCRTICLFFTYFVSWVPCERFLHFDSGPNDTKRIMVFTTLPGLDLLSGADDWFCDGTFSTAPSVFFQIYTIHASVEGILIPIVYALLPDKKEETYFRLLSCFDIEFPKRATIDFEIAVKNAFNSVSQNVQIQYCYFHLSQSVWRHIQTTGNTNNYRLDLEFREHVRMLLSIAFVPVSDVSTAFETLQKTCPETAHPIFNYFEDNYVGRLSAANGTRQKPRFDVDSWSCHQRVITARPRTNNAVEGWNSNFVKLVNGKHPSFPKLIEKFQDEQKNAEIFIEKMCAGQKVSRYKKPLYVKLDKNLSELVAAYDPSKLLSFLQGCSSNIKL